MYAEMAHKLFKTNLKPYHMQFLLLIDMRLCSPLLYSECSCFIQLGHVKVSKFYYHLFAPYYSQPLTYTHECSRTQKSCIISAILHFAGLEITSSGNCSKTSFAFGKTDASLHNPVTSHPCTQFQLKPFYLRKLP